MQQRKRRCRLLLENKQKRDLLWQNFCHLLVLSLLFSISSKPGQVSYNLYQQLPSLFQSFLQFSPADLGVKILHAVENFCGRIFVFLLDIQT